MVPQHKRRQGAKGINNGDGAKDLMVGSSLAGWITTQVNEKNTFLSSLVFSRLLILHVQDFRFHPQSS